jgi:hypothetical protein
MLFKVARVNVVSDRLLAHLHKGKLLVFDVQSRYLDHRPVIERFSNTKQAKY